MQEVTAQLNFLRMGPRKVRLVVDLIRGKKVSRALDVLALLNKKASRPIKKLLESAIANAKHNFSLDAEDLKVEKITVDGGPMLKRWMPKAHGRATPVRERTSHIKLILNVVEKSAKGGSVSGGKEKKTTEKIKK